MSLLSEERIKEIIDAAHKAEFKAKPAHVPVFILRYISFAFALLFFILTFTTALSSFAMAFMPLMMGICWLLTALIFHLQWVRYSENYAFKTTLDKLEKSIEELQKEEN